MKNIKQMGIWMDHSGAFLMELKDDAILQNAIASEFTHLDKEEGLSKSEKHMHIKEQHLHSSYYKKISDAIKNYQEVVLFGPTEAKEELLNLLKNDHLFENIKISIKNTDKMTEYQMHTFVKEYFK
jgi:hypothetical protein